MANEIWGLTLLLSVASTGCLAPDRPHPLPDLGESRRAVVAPAPAASPAGSATGLATPTAFKAGPAAYAEVELTGNFVVPKAATGERYVFVAAGSCWADGSRLVGKAMVSAKALRYFVEVFVPQGSYLRLCAAAVSRPDAVSYTADVGPIKAEGLGEVEIRKDLALTKGPIVHLPSSWR